MPSLASGHFTQEDPIGIAGGLNLYGYANGDPINFSDPFGLCAEDERGTEDPDCRALINIVSGVLAREGLSGSTRDELTGAVRFLELMSTNVALIHAPERSNTGPNRTLEDRLWLGSNNGEGFSGGTGIEVNVAFGPVNAALTTWHEIQHRKVREPGHRIIGNKQVRLLQGLPAWLQAQASETEAYLNDLRRQGVIR